MTVVSGSDGIVRLSINCRIDGLMSLSKTLSICPRCRGLFPLSVSVVTYNSEVLLKLHLPTMANYVPALQSFRVDYLLPDCVDDTAATGLTLRVTIGLFHLGIVSACM